MTIQGNNMQHDHEPGAPAMISVVVPSYNRVDILPRCLESLTKQTYANREVVVVDDGSTDGTAEYLRGFAAEHPNLRLRWFINEGNRGANASRNRGIRESQGELIAFLDSDCIAEPDWLDELAGGFDSDDVATVTGRVQDPQPTNIYELTLKGMHRVHGRGEAPRLIAGNMCIRRHLLLEYPLDEDLKYGGDEEGIYLRLKAAGYRQRLVPQALVRHEHYYTRRSFFRQARIGGAAAAWMVYKYRLPPRVDLAPLILTYLTLPAVLLNSPWAWVPAVFAAAFCAALAYNELWRKRKTLGETILVFPVLLAYYQVRLAGHLWQYGGHVLGLKRVERINLRELRQQCTGNQAWRGSHD